MSENDLGLWDAAAQAYAASVGSRGDSFYRRVRDFLGERFGDVTGLDVLDLGCGHGWLAEELRLAGGRVTGVDGSGALLDEASYSRAILDGGPGKRYREVPDYLTHETRWVTLFGGHQHYHRPLSWYVDRLVAHGLVVNGLHEPPSLPRDDVPEAEWTEYQHWFSRIPTMLAISCVKASG